MGQFRKKPVVIEAFHFVGLAAHNESVMVLKCADDSPVPTWLNEAFNKTWEDPGSIKLHANGEALMIATLEGAHIATPGDWIIQGVKGELYPCKPDIFAATYDPVDA